VDSFRYQASPREDILEGDIGWAEDLVREDLEADGALAEFGSGHIDPGHNSDQVARPHQAAHPIADVARVAGESRQGEEIELGSEPGDLSCFSHQVLDFTTLWSICNIS
jgi:hypothetical protein